MKIWKNLKNYKNNNAKKFQLSSVIAAFVFGKLDHEISWPHMWETCFEIWNFAIVFCSNYLKIYEFHSKKKNNIKTNSFDNTRQNCWKTGGFLFLFFDKTTSCPFTTLYHFHSFSLSPFGLFFVLLKEKNFELNVKIWKLFSQNLCSFPNMVYLERKVSVGSVVVHFDHFGKNFVDFVGIAIVGKKRCLGWMVVEIWEGFCGFLWRVCVVSFCVFWKNRKTFFD